MKLRSFLFLLFGMALNVGVAFGQNSTAIKGIVTDPNGAVVAGATVTLAEQNGTNRRTSVTDAASAFSFDSLPTGNYRLTVEKTGFAVLTQTVTSGAGELSLKLQVSDLALRVVERYFGREEAKNAAFKLEYQGTGWMYPNSNAQFAKKPVSTNEHPVCPVYEGVLRRIKKENALNTTYKGKTYYFCGEWCHTHFMATPQRFAEPSR